MISFSVPAVPVAQPRPRAVAIAGHARVYGAPSSHPVHAFRATVRLAAREAHHGPPLDGPVQLAVRFLLPRPRSRVWKSKPMPREWHDSRPDADNMLKAVKDALSGLIWRDDCQVSREVVEKYRCSGDEQPGVTVFVESLYPAAAQAERAAADLFSGQDPSHP